MKFANIMMKVEWCWNDISFEQKLDQELTKRRPDVRQVSEISGKILGSCHPAAVKTVKYYASFTEAEWHKVTHNKH